MKQIEKLSDIRKNIAFQRKEHNIKKQTCLTMTKNYKQSRKYVDSVQLYLNLCLILLLEQLTKSCE